MRPIEEEQAALNQFYFQEFVPSLPPALRELATNPLVLYHRNLENPITEVAQQVRLEYWLTPWLLRDIFELDEGNRQYVANGFLLVFLAYLVLDHLVDGQAPEEPLIPLLSHQFYLAAERQFSQVLKHDESFWQAWLESLKSHTDGLSLEYQSVNQMNPPFSEARMRDVAIGKAMPFRLAAEAMGRLTGKENLIPIVSQAYFLHMFADQFYDDADDYLDDWQNKRATMAHVYLAEVKNIPVQEIFTWESTQVKDAIFETGIREKMLGQSTRLLTEALALLPDELQNTALAEILRKRLEMDEILLKSFRAVGFLQRLKNSLK